jgi:WD40 repeat protein
MKKDFILIVIVSLFIFSLKGFASSDLAYSPDEKYAAMISSDGTIKICESKLSVDSKEPVLGQTKDPNFKISLIPIYSLTQSDSKQSSAICWSPDGNFFSAGSVGGVIDIWHMNEDAQTKLCKSLVVSQDLDSISNLAWSVDGEFLASVLKDRIIQVWGINFSSVCDQELFNFDLYSLFNNRAFQINSLDWSPCGNFIALNICSASGAECKIESMVLDVKKIYEKMDFKVTCSK